MSETKISACPVLITKLPPTAPPAWLTESSRTLATLKRHWWAIPVVGVLLLVCFSSKLMPRRHWSAAPQPDAVQGDSIVQVVPDQPKPAQAPQVEVAVPVSELPVVHDAEVQQAGNLQVIELPPLPAEPQPTTVPKPQVVQPAVTIPPSDLQPAPPTELTLPDMSQQENKEEAAKPAVHASGEPSVKLGGFSDETPASEPVTVVKESASQANTGAMHEIACLKGHGDTVSCAAFVPGKRWVLSGSHDHALILWDLTTGKQVNKFGVHPSEINCLAVTRDGKKAITGSGQYVIHDGKQVPMDCMIRLWDLETGKELHHFAGHSGPITSLAMAPDDSCFLSASYDRSIRLWDMSNGRVLRSFTGHTKGVQCVVFGADSRSAISAGGTDGTVRVWDLRSGQEIACLRGNSGPVKCVVALPDGKHVASGGGDITNGDHGSMHAFGCTINVWDLTTGKVVHSFQGGQLPVTSLACSPNGNRLISGDVGGSVCLWNLNGNAERPFATMTDNGWVWASEFAADGHTCLSAGSDRSIKLWKLP